MQRRDVLRSVAAGLPFLAGCSMTRSGDRTLDPATRRTTQTGTATRTESPTATSSEAATPPETAAPPASEVERRALATGKRLQQSVVLLEYGPGGGRTATGWLIDGETIVTNAHVIRGQPEFQITTYDDTTVEASILGFDEDMMPDVGALTIDTPGEITEPPLPTGSTGTLEAGQSLVQVGHPSMVGYWAISMGEFVRQPRGMDRLLSTVPGKPGNSGSPVATLDGEVVGVTSGGTPTANADVDYRQSPQVFTEFPDVTYASHVPIEIVERKLGTWR